MNILLILVDALRTDHLGISGYNRDTSPNIDKIAKKGTYFTTAIPTVARTDPSIVSIFTGLYPHSSGVRFLEDKLTPPISLLQEILKSNGYNTIGHDIEMGRVGIHRGFDVFNPLSWRVINKIKRWAKKTINWGYEVNPAETLTNFGIKHINKLKDDKFFLYLHYIGLHWPYTPPQPYDDMFDSDYTGEHTFNKIGGKIKRGDLIFNNTLPKEEIEHAIAHYDGSLRFIDFQIGRLLKHLDDLNLTEDTLIIISADHAETFGEHGIYFDHGSYLYDEELKVPLILKHPKLPKKKIEEQVQLIDVSPTVLELLDIPLKEGIDGVSLMPLIKEGKGVREYVFAESGKSFLKENKRRYIEGINGKWRMIRTDEWKLIYIPHPEKDIYELYNIKNDPLETKNRINEKKEVVEFLKQKLFLWIDKKKVHLKEDKEPYSKKDEKKVKERLRALGYID